MKTTVDIDPDLLKAAKKRAIDEGTTFRAIVERGLRRELEDRAGGSERAERLREMLSRNRERLAAERASGAAATATEEKRSWRSELYEEHLVEKEREADRARAAWQRRQKPA